MRPQAGIEIIFRRFNGMTAPDQNRRQIIPDSKMLA